MEAPPLNAIITWQFHLPSDLIRKLLYLLHWHSLVMFMRASKRFYLIAKVEEIWKKKALLEFGGPALDRYKRFDIDYISERYQRLYKIYMTQTNPMFIYDTDPQTGKLLSHRETHPAIQIPDKTYYCSLPASCFVFNPPVEYQDKQIVAVENKKFKGWRQTFMRYLRREIDLLSRSIIKYIHSTLPVKPEAHTIYITEDEMKWISAKNDVAFILSHGWPSIEFVYKYQLRPQVLYIAMHQEKKIYLFLAEARLHNYVLSKKKRGYPRCLNLHLKYHYDLYPRDVGRFFGLEYLK